MAGPVSSRNLACKAAVGKPTLNVANWIPRCGFSQFFKPLLTRKAVSFKNDKSLYKNVIQMGFFDSRIEVSSNTLHTPLKGFGVSVTTSSNTIGPPRKILADVDGNFLHNFRDDVPEKSDLIRKFLSSSISKTNGYMLQTLFQWPLHVVFQRLM
ncbi:hypothetical protein PGT21_033632 [Puccinia graminis f. sp. tritici]|uniref:Uncharacterized protein n=1 Tax=Puccinia graminis f. sp. tritici TaxID=56615 RepID=A0A5B0LQB4_PUCGR|nr:hypothetical protein PGT21_033632 [Puccinia graminis f. sp. tritici]